MIERTIQTGPRQELEETKARLTGYISSSSELIIDAGGLILVTDCIDHDLAVIRAELASLWT